MKIGWYSEKCDQFVYLFCRNTGTKFREPYHSNHKIPHREKLSILLGDQILSFQSLLHLHGMQNNKRRVASPEVYSFTLTTQCPIKIYQHLDQNFSFELQHVTVVI